MSGRPNGGDAEYDVMSAEPMGDDDGHDWNANEMARGPGDEESEPLDDDPNDVGADIEQAIGDEEDPDGQDLETAEEGDDEGEEGDEEAQNLEPIEPPNTWPEQVRQAFSACPPQLQHWYVNSARHMQADYTRKTQAIAQERQQLGQYAQQYAELDRVTAPYEQQWALNGMSKPQAVAQLIALSDFATRDAAGFIQYFANLRGIDLHQLNAEQEYVDPQVAALRQPIAQVQAQLNQMAQQQAQREQQQQQHQYQQAERTVHAGLDEFARQTGQDGKPLHPYFNEVMGEMASLIESGQARSVPEAYRQAVWLNEGTRARELARSRNAENAKAREQAQRARRAASSLHGASGANGAFAPRDMSIRDTINAAYDGSL